MEYFFRADETPDIVLGNRSDIYKISKETISEKYVDINIEYKGFLFKLYYTGEWRRKILCGPAVEILKTHTDWKGFNVNNKQKGFITLLEDITFFIDEYYMNFGRYDDYDEEIEEEC